jgi:hypothetical protein
MMDIKPHHHSTTKDFNGTSRQPGLGLFKGDFFNQIKGQINYLGSVLNQIKGQIK